VIIAVSSFLEKGMPELYYVGEFSIVHKLYETQLPTRSSHISRRMHSPKKFFFLGNYFGFASSSLLKHQFSTSERTKGLCFALSRGLV
jgi:hypothetical protein